MIHNFNSSFVYWENAINHTTHKQQIKRAIFKYENKNKVFEKHTAYHNYFLTMTLTEEFKSSVQPLINQSILPALNNMKEELSLNCGTSFDVIDIWCNYYKPGGWNGVHDHQRCEFSGVYLLELNEPNNTIFYNFTGNPALCPRFTTEHIKEGSILLFPSHLMHEVKPCSKEKITIAFDVKCNYTNIYEGQTTAI